MQLLLDRGRTRLYQYSVIANFMYSYSVYSYDDRAYSYGLIKPKN